MTRWLNCDDLPIRPLPTAPPPHIHTHRHFGRAVVWSPRFCSLLVRLPGRRHQRVLHLLPHQCTPIVVVVRWGGAQGWGQRNNNGGGGRHHPPPTSDVSSSRPRLLRSVGHGGRDDSILSTIQAKSSGHQRNSCQILQNRATESRRACTELVPKLLLRIPLYVDFSILIPLCRLSMSIIASSAYLLGP
jgi:hypothetical protein